MTLKDWNTVIGVNLTGQFSVPAKPCAPSGAGACATSPSRRQDRLHELGPRHHPLGRARELCRQQGGVMLMMKSIAQEVAPWRIRANAIAPGVIRTPINRAAWETPEAYADLMRLIPYKRIGEPEDIARAAVWLASDEADYLTGTTLYVDGGMTLYPGFEAGVRHCGDGGVHGDTGPALARISDGGLGSRHHDLGGLVHGAGDPSGFAAGRADPLVQRTLIGSLMGLTAVGIIYSPWGRQSGAHLNPAVTLTFFRLGKVAGWDALFYVMAQILGGLAGVLLVLLARSAAFADPPVAYIATFFQGRPARPSPSWQRR